MVRVQAHDQQVVEQHLLRNPDRRMMCGPGDLLSLLFTSTRGYHPPMRYLQNLTIGEMIAVTEQWTGPLKSVFIAIPELTPFYGRIDEDHGALVNARQSGTAESLLRTLNDQADGLDTRHDHLQRALHFALRSAREALLGLAPPNTTLASAIDDAYEALLPNGLEINNASYEGESGNAAQMVKLAQTQYADVLNQVPLAGNITALEAIVEIGKVGAALGETEQKKSIAAAAVENETVTPSEVRKRMRAWASTVELVIGALERSKANADSIGQIRRPIEDAVEKARVRRLAKQNASVKKDPEPAAPAPSDQNSP